MEYTVLMLVLIVPVIIVASTWIARVRGGIHRGRPRATEGGDPTV
jgi:hypothetical protein